MSKATGTSFVKRRGRSTLALGAVAFVSLPLFAGTLLGAGCTNTTVFDRPDPLQCADGNGCGIAVCQCTDLSFMIDSACEKGKCVDPQTICQDRCTAFGGVSKVVSTTGDTFALPSCEVLDDRMFINGCKEGLDLFATSCVSGTSCSSESEAFWQCIEGEAILSCARGALHAVGCKAPPPLALCTGTTK